MFSFLLGGGGRGVMYLLLKSENRWSGVRGRG